jgi:hypothetical protein
MLVHALHLVGEEGDDHTQHVIGEATDEVKAHRGPLPIWLDPHPLVGVHLSGRRHTQPRSLLSERHSISVP